MSSNWKNLFTNTPLKLTEKEKHDFLMEEENGNE